MVSATLDTPRIENKSDEHVKIVSFPVRPMSLHLLREHGHAVQFCSGDRHFQENTSRVSSCSQPPPAMKIWFGDSVKGAPTFFHLKAGWPASCLFLAKIVTPCKTTRKIQETGTGIVCAELGVFENSHSLIGSDERWNYSHL